MYSVRPPWWLRSLLDKSALWRMPPSAPVVYLTFDDGPHPEATPFVLEQLAKYNGKGTFFCIGQNVREFPAVYDRILAEGHRTGNHTEHHLNGWRCSVETYLDDVAACTDVIHSKLFRPPYGCIRRAAAARLRKLGYQIVMWDVLTWDFDTRLSAHDCMQRALRHVRPGSVVVFHDSTKAWPRMHAALPALLEHIVANGWRIEALPEG